MLSLTRLTTHRGTPFAGGQEDERLLGPRRQDSLGDARLPQDGALLPAHGVVQARQGGQVGIDGRVQALLRPGQGGLGVHDVRRGGVAVAVFDPDQAQVLLRLDDRGPGELDTLAGGHLAPEGSGHLEADPVQNGLRVGDGGSHLGLGRAELAAEQAAGVQGELQVETGPRLPPGQHMRPVHTARTGPDKHAREKRGLGHDQALLSGHDGFSGEADFRALGRRHLQALHQRWAGFGRGRLQVEDPERQGGMAPHDVVQLGDGHELCFLGADEGIPAFRQLHLGTQHVVGVRHPSLETGPCVLQRRLRLTDGLLLHPERRARQEDVQVGGGHVKLHGLVGADELELGDPLPAAAC